ncbi:hypothetical protein FVEN_g13110 [Fusarium venenatum]|nr:hypothetical protein FVEN_g13110 [Fusarium venenatum]
MFLGNICQIKLDAADINRIKLKTIDNAQGDEAELVIFDSSLPCAEIATLRSVCDGADSGYQLAAKQL